MTLEQARRLKKRLLERGVRSGGGAVDAPQGSVLGYHDPAKALYKTAKKAGDVISTDVPLFIRLLEWAHEDAKTDKQLHKATTNLISMGGKGALNMDNYDKAVGGEGMPPAMKTASFVQGFLDELEKDAGFRAKARLWKRKIFGPPQSQISRMNLKADAHHAAFKFSGAAKDQRSAVNTAKMLRRGQALLNKRRGIDKMLNIPGNVMRRAGRIAKEVGAPLAVGGIAVATPLIALGLLSASARAIRKRGKKIDKLKTKLRKLKHKRKK